MVNNNLSGKETALNDVRELCHRVESAYGSNVTTAQHFDALAESIRERTGVLLSPTTLKRLWGYLKEGVSPRITTLDVLARYCGWRSFESFTQSLPEDPESGNLGARTLHADTDVRRGDCVTLTWPPGRVCVIEYLGGGNWKVVSAVATRLSPGDTFSCKLIVAGEPLYLDNLSHSGCKPGVYVCGRRSGVTFSC